MLDQILKDNVLYHAIIGAVIVAVFYLLSSFVKKVLSWVGKKIFAKTKTLLDDLILDAVRRNVRSLMVIAGLHVAVREIRKGTTAADLTLNQILDYADSVLYIAALVVLLKITIGILRVLIDWYLDQMTNDAESNLKNTLGPLTSKIVNILVGMVAVIILLDHFGINIGSLLVSLGVGSLAVALAAQDTLANMIAGFVILIDRPFRVGDRIELPTGQVGDVHQIGLRSTKIINFDNNVIIMPNAELVKSRIINYSYPHEPMRVLLRFELAHGTDTDRVRTMLLPLAEQHPDVLRDPPPRVVFTALTDLSLQCTFVCRSNKYDNAFDIEVLLREQAYQAFQREKIELAIPQRLVRMKQEA